MATNWEISRLRELVNDSRCMVSEDNVKFWNSVLDKPSSAVKHSSEIRNYASMLENIHSRIMNEEQQRLVREGNDQRAQEIAIRMKQKEIETKTETEKSFYETTDKRVRSKIVGQDEVLSQVKKKLFVTALLTNEGINRKPRALVFAGGSTNGKTETAMKIGEMLCSKALKIQMSNFTMEHDISMLLGASAGYIGYNEKTVIERYMESVNGKYCIVFDEIEKAHPKVFKFLLELLDTGFLTLMNGKSLDLRNSVFMFTSNAGAKTVREQIGFVTEKRKTNNGNTMATDPEHVKKEVISLFPPEVVNRIGRDNIFVFRDLDETDRKKIVSNMINESLDELSETISCLMSSKLDKKMTSKLRKTAMESISGKLCERSLRELREDIVDSLVLTASGRMV